MATTVRKPAESSADQTADESWLPITLRLRPVIHLTSDHLLELSAINEGLKFELSAEGDLIVMPPPGGRTSDRNSEINFQLRGWAKRDGTGVAYDSSGGFDLPDGATLGPDGAWVLKSRLEPISLEQQEKALPLCPDFVLELRSPSDRLPPLQRKMRQYLANGARLGWLIDPYTKQVEVYRPDTPVERLDHPATISGDPVLPGFVLDLQEIW